MNVLLGLIGLLSFLAGLFAFASVRSDIQLILGFVLWGFAVVFFAIAAVSRHLDKIERGVRKIVRAIEEGDRQ